MNELFSKRELYQNVRVGLSDNTIRSNYFEYSRICDSIHIPKIDFKRYRFEVLHF